MEISREAHLGYLEVVARLPVTWVFGFRIMAAGTGTPSVLTIQEISHTPTIMPWIHSLI